MESGKFIARYAFFFFLFLCLCVSLELFIVSAALSSTRDPKVMRRKIGRRAATFDAIFLFAASPSQRDACLSVASLALNCLAVMAERGLGDSVVAQAPI